MQSYIVIGIGGVTNSGKTTLCENIIRKLAKADILHLDNYFWEPGDSRLIYVPEVGHHNWEAMSAIDWPRLELDVQDFIQLKSTTWNLGESPSIMLIEGFLIYNYEPLQHIYKKKYFLEVPKEVSSERRRTRQDYNPPDPPNYFEKVAWPQYLERRAELQLQSDIVFLDGRLPTEDLSEKILADISSLMTAEI